MLNLNYNIIGSIKQEYKNTMQYQVRNDPYSASLVVAIPGCLFKNGLSQNQFGMSQPYDDISGYVKGTNTNLQILVSSSLNPLSSSIYATSSIVKWDNPQDAYTEALVLSGSNSLVVNQLWAAGEGANLTFSKQWAMETYVAFEATQSASPSSPNRIFAWKYDPGVASGSQYFWSTYSSTVDAGVSGSHRIVYNFNGESEASLNTPNSQVGNYVWNHIAISYSPANRRLYMFINGVLQLQSVIPLDSVLNQDTNELLQILGAVDSSFAPELYGGSKAIFQDFRIYNGSNKGYSDDFTPPPSMVYLS
jgi:hypothetical protein